MASSYARRLHGTAHPMPAKHNGTLHYRNSIQHEIVYRKLHNSTQLTRAPHASVWEPNDQLNDRTGLAPIQDGLSVALRSVEPVDLWAGDH